AAYMSTISTQLNWGSSYIVNDFYKQQIKPSASEKELVGVGRISTVVLMVLSAVMALSLTNAKQLFDILLMFGAGTGLVYILRWFWWRINAWSEISVMFAAATVSLIFTYSSLGDSLFGFVNESGTIIDGIMPSWVRFPGIVLITSVVWVVATFVTKPEKKEVLNDFYKKTRPGGPGWKKVLDDASADGIDIEKSNEKWSVPSGILAMILGCVLVYSCMFATGNWIYGNYVLAGWLTAVMVIAGFLLVRVWNKMKDDIL
ncbi:MAG: sodium:solute symporter family transporter, partial [Aurantibacter sp.]